MIAKVLPKQGLRADTAWLLLSNMVVKGLGFVYRVWLVRLLGAEGMGLVEMTAPLFSFLIVLSGLGLQTALTQSSAAQPQKRNLYFAAARRFLLVSGVCVAALGFAASGWLSAWLVADSRCLLCLRCLLPAVAIIAAAAPYRGLLQGCNYTRALAASQNGEQLTRVLTGLVFTAALLPQGLETAVCGAALATVAGEAVGFLVLLLAYQRRGLAAEQKACRFSGSQRQAARQELLRYGLPITGSRLAATAIMAVQALLLPLCLQAAGWDSRAATELYGRFSGVALTLVHLPGVFTAALSVTMMPAVAASRERLTRHRRIQATLDAALVCTLPAMAFLWLFALPCCTLIFHNAPAAEILRPLAIGGMLFYLQAAASSILQGLGQVRLLLRNSIAAGLTLLGLIVLLVGPLGWGIVGAAWATALSWALGFLLNYGGLLRVSGFRWPVRAWLPPLLATALTVALLLAARPQASTLASLLLAALATVTCYGLLYWGLRKSFCRRKDSSA